MNSFFPVLNLFKTYNKMVYYQNPPDQNPPAFKNHPSQNPSDQNQLEFFYFFFEIKIDS